MNALIEGEHRGLGEPSGRHLALPRVSRKPSRDPESLSWVLSQRRKSRKGFPRGEAQVQRHRAVIFHDGRG